ncbi:MAG: hypothetical protein CVU79_09030 [Elusimicrobia bacterium HGW-Elusimicrobia-3]|nr:MAG: hypothetical protein CVU79_09030 [Elusimicrobia bacterium HGW-Elusimicrobia-3]
MTPPAKTVKYTLLAFVAVSVGVAVYKALPCCSGDGAPAAAAVEAAVPAPAAPAAAAVPAAKRKKPAAVKAAQAKTAVVYYFYTNARCSSCTTIEAYTREAVSKHFAQPYKGWRVEFRGVNIDEKANEHFTRDYWLSSKSVVVQKFEGEKALEWGMLKSVWQLLGDKEKFMDYVASETRKVLDGA